MVLLLPAARSALMKGAAVPARPTTTICGLAAAISLAAGSTSMLVVPGVVAITTGSILWRVIAAAEEVQG